MEHTAQPPQTDPYLVQFKIVLMMTLSHFETPGLLDDQRMEHAMECGRQVFVKSQKQAEVRYVHFNLSLQLFSYDPIRSLYIVSSCWDIG